MYKKVERIPVILTDKGNPTNFHRLTNGNIGERVTEQDCTHYIVHTYELIVKD